MLLTRHIQDLTGAPPSALGELRFRQVPGPLREDAGEHLLEVVSEYPHEIARERPPQMAVAQHWE